MRFRTIKVLAAASTLVATTITGTSSANAEEVTCDSGFGAKTPVLMIHGFNGDPRMWLEGGVTSSMQAALSGIQGAASVEAFDYKNSHFNWVTDENIGPKLAKTIDCLSRASRKGGGDGKVIAVAHSMGGLALREAANQTVEGRKVGDQLGLVFTLATPHLGSPWATNFGGGWRWYCGIVVGNAADRDQEMERCRLSTAISAMSEGSPEISALPKFPPGVRVRAITGQVKVVGQLLFAGMSLQLSDDLVVTVPSATSQHTTLGGGDGKFVFQCETRIIATLLPGGGQLGNLKVRPAECGHNEMYKTKYIQEAVQNGIKEYLATKQGTLTDFFGVMQLRLGSTWKTKLQNGIQEATDTSCARSQVCMFTVYGPSFLEGLGTSWQNVMSDVPECSAGGDSSAFGEITQKGERSIGGRQAKYYEAQLCKPGYPQQTMRIWEVAGPKPMLISTVSGEKYGMVDIDPVLANASWK